MTDQFVDINKMVPITPSPELVRQWLEDSPEDDELGISDYIATQAARWGSDQELEACINYFYKYDTSWGEDSDLIVGLRADRRPKPPNKKQRGLTALEATNLKKDDPLLYQEILNAIEGLPDD